MTPKWKIICSGETWHASDPTDGSTAYFNSFYEALAYFGAFSGVKVDLGKFTPPVSRAVISVPPYDAFQEITELPAVNLPTIDTTKPCRSATNKQSRRVGSRVKRKQVAVSFIDRIPSHEPKKGWSDLEANALFAMDILTKERYCESNSHRRFIGAAF